MALEMYQENILDHYKHPRNFGTIPDAPFHAHVANPLCGDELDFYLSCDPAGRITDVKFSGRGCTISLASASMLSERLKSMTRQDIDTFGVNDVLTMLGVPVNPARLKCATLSLEAVQQSLSDHHDISR